MEETKDGLRVVCHGQCEDLIWNQIKQFQSLNWFTLYFLKINNPFSNREKLYLSRKTRENSGNWIFIREQIKEIRYIDYLLFFKINLKNFARA